MLFKSVQMIYEQTHSKKLLSLVFVSAAEVEEKLFKHMNPHWNLHKV